jgi:hypothetical protein
MKFSGLSNYRRHDPEIALDLIGGGGWTRTSDLRIMSCPADIDNKGYQSLSSEESGKLRQNPQAGRKQIRAKRPPPV